MGAIKYNWFPEELSAAKPPEAITVSEWACKYRELGKLSAVTGLYTLAFTPFWGPPMDACADPDIEQVVVCGPAQSGKTVAMVENVVGFYLHQDPSSIMVVLADEDTANFVSTEKIGPMFKDSSSLSKLYNKKNFNNACIETPNGARVDMAWASSVAKIASRPERVVICDEVDKPGYSKKTKEAAAISLVKERTKSYPSGFYKHIFTSTPTTKEGNIIGLLDASEAVFDWHVPCPYCGVFQPLRWTPEYSHGFKEGMFRGDGNKMYKLGRVSWEGGGDATPTQIKDTARYECGECGEHWTTVQKNQAVGKGKIVGRAEPTGKERKVGFHLNRIYPLFDSGRIDILVEEFLSACRVNGEQKAKMLQGFVNSALAEPFSQVIRVTEESDLLKARCSLPGQTVPQEAVALTCFVDVQKYGFWFCVRAFARDHTSWLIHYGPLVSWADVENLLFDTYYPVQDSTRTMKIWRAGVDTGGGKKYEDMSMTEETYWWLRKNAVGRGCRVWGTKGSSNPFPGKIKVGKPLDKTPSGKSMPGGLQIISLNTNDLKDAFHYRLAQAIDNGPQAAYLHGDTDDSYIQQITAEEKQLNDKGIAEWVAIRKDNHYLDCECGCLVLAEPEWIGGGVELVPVFDETPRSQTRPVRKSNWMSR